MLKTIISFLWNHCPLWLKLSLAICALPALGLIYYQAWHIGSIKSYVDPIQARNEERFIELSQKIENHYQVIRDDSKELKQQNSIMFQHMLRLSER